MPFELYELSSAETPSLILLKSRYNRAVIHIIYERYTTQEEKQGILRDLEELRKEIEQHK